MQMARQCSKLSRSKQLSVVTHSVVCIARPTIATAEQADDDMVAEKAMVAMVAMTTSRVVSFFGSADRSC